MNLHALVTPAVSMVNSPVLGAVSVSNGYTTEADGSRVPAYVTTTGVPLQVQALSAREIEHLDSLNITGLMQAIHLNGFLEALDRSASKGGDLIVFDASAPVALANTTWLVVQVLERWPASGWCRVAVQKQAP